MSILAIIFIILYLNETNKGATKEISKTDEMVQDLLFKITRFNKDIYDLRKKISGLQTILIVDVSMEKNYINQQIINDKLFGVNLIDKPISKIHRSNKECILHNQIYNLEIKIEKLLDYTEKKKSILELEEELESRDNRELSLLNEIFTIKRKVNYFQEKPWNVFRIRLDEEEMHRESELYILRKRIRSEEWHQTQKRFESDVVNKKLDVVSKKLRGMKPPPIYPCYSNIYGIEREGVSKWRMTYELEEELQMGNEHKRGGRNDQGDYIVGDRATSSIYIYYLGDMTTPPSIYIEHLALGGIANHCMFVSEDIALCCYTTGYILRYQLTNKLITSTTIFFYDAAHQFISLLQTHQHFILAGTHKGSILIFKENGDLIKTLDQGGKIGEVEEVREQIIVSVEHTHGLFAHDLTQISGDPSNHQTFTRKLSDYMDLPHSYYTLCALSYPQPRAGYFAVGGQDSNSGAIITIQQLNTDLTNNVIKASTRMGHFACDFKSLRELNPGLIFIGGDVSCDFACYWAYITQPLPYCWPLQGNKYFNDWVVGLCS